MNWTAVLHATATVVAGVGVFAFDQPTVGLLVVAAVLFVAGIAVARRDDGTVDPPDSGR